MKFFGLRRTRRRHIDHAHRRLEPHLIERVSFHPIVEPRDRRLRRERIPGDRAPARQQLVDRLADELLRIVGVGMPVGEAQGPPREQVREHVPRLGRLPLINEAPRGPVDQAIVPLGRLEQPGTAVGLACG